MKPINPRVLPLTQRAFHNHPGLARAFDAIVADHGLGFWHRVEYLVAVIGPDTLPAFRAYHRGQRPSDMSALHKAMAFDDQLAGFVEKLGELERFDSEDHPPLTDLVVEVFERMGVDPYPRIDPGAGAARTWLN